MEAWEIAVISVAGFAIIMVVVSFIIFCRQVIKNQQSNSSDYKKLITFWRLNGLTAPIYLGLLLLIACLIVAIVFSSI